MECADRERFNNYFRFELQAWGVELMLRGRVQKMRSRFLPGLRAQGYAALQREGERRIKALESLPHSSKVSTCLGLGCTGATRSHLSLARDHTTRSRSEYELHPLAISTSLARPMCALKDKSHHHQSHLTTILFDDTISLRVSSYILCLAKNDDEESSPVFVVYHTS